MRISFPLAAFLALLLLGVATIWIWQSSSSDDQGNAQATTLEEDPGALALENQGTEGGLIDRNTITIPGEGGPFANEYSRSTVRVQVLDPDGVGVEGVRLIPWVGVEIGEEQVTDASGMVEFEFLYGYGGIAFAAPNRFPDFQPMVLGSDLIVHNLEVGEVLAGRITCSDGSSAKDSLTLEVLTILLYFPSAISAHVQFRFSERGWDLESRQLAIQDDGSFRLEGLPSDWAGELNMDGGYLISSFSGPAEMVGYQELFLDGAAQGLAIELFPIPAFHGRLVAGEPGAKLDVEIAYLKVTQTDGNITFSEGCLIDEHGFFQDMLWPQSEEDFLAWQKEMPQFTPDHVEASWRGYPKTSRESFKLGPRGSHSPSH
jgi:hypothetical protein